MQVKCLKSGHTKAVGILYEAVYYGCLQLEAPLSVGVHLLCSISKVKEVWGQDYRQITAVHLILCTPVNKQRKNSKDKKILNERWMLHGNPERRIQLNKTLAPLGHVVEEVKKVTQGGQVSVWQHTGQQHGGRHPVLRCGELLGLEKGFLQLCGQHRLQQLPEELLHQTGHITGECGGQALLTSVQFCLNKQSNSVVLDLSEGQGPSVNTRSTLAITHPERFQANDRARFSEQALSVDVCQQFHACVDQKAKEGREISLAQNLQGRT